MNSDGIPIHNGRINLSSTSGVAAYADTAPAPTADDNGRKGWLHVKASGTQKLNYYFYSEGSAPVTLANLENAYFVGIINNWTNFQNIPFLVVYTKPQGAGDGGSWYRTKRTFGVHTGTGAITLGMRTQFSMFANPTPTFPFENVVLNSPTVVGPNVSTEEILTIAVATDSTSADGTSVLISHVGWKARGGHSAANPNLLLSGN